MLAQDILVSTKALDLHLNERLSVCAKFEWSMSNQ